MALSVVLELVAAEAVAVGLLLLVWFADEDDVDADVAGAVAAVVVVVVVVVEEEDAEDVVAAAAAEDEEDVAFVAEDWAADALDDEVVEDLTLD